MIQKTILMGALALLCAALPSGLMAQTVNLPFLCIEKTNGEVVKVEITETSPNMWYGTIFSEEEDRPVPCLLVQGSHIDDIKIALRDIKRTYSRFEEVDAVTYLKADGVATSEDVYNIGGVRVGTVGQLASLPRGVYIVKKGSRTHKIVNK